MRPAAAASAGQQTAQHTRTGRLDTHHGVRSTPAPASAPHIARAVPPDVSRAASTHTPRRSIPAAQAGHTARSMKQLSSTAQHSSPRSIVASSNAERVAAAAACKRTPQWPTRAAAALQPRQTSAPSNERCAVSTVLRPCAAVPACAARRQRLAPPLAHIIRACAAAARCQAPPSQPPAPRRAGCAARVRSSVRAACRVRATVRARHSRQVIDHHQRAGSRSARGARTASCMPSW